jgi:hypothetical protein
MGSGGVERVERLPFREREPQAGERGRFARGNSTRNSQGTTSRQISAELTRTRRRDLSDGRGK